MSTDDEQTKYLSEAKRKVAEQSFHMKRAMDSSDLPLTLEHAADMLRELKTSLLTPKNYYELYMLVLDEMRYIEEFVMALNKAGKPMVELYELVQHCANVVPRLYLLVAVGGVYVTSGEAPAKDILKDLIEMVKCVQYPTRGLFLRNYLSQVSRDKLPDTGSQYEGVGGDVTDAYEFVLQNFAEMNRLWVRLQHMGGSKETRKKREKERQELRILVGTNLVRLSQLEGIDATIYKETILPRILEQINTCKDTIAQSYLMDCVIQVFPDEFHLATLETFLSTCTMLKEKVNIRSILQNMMNRLSNYSDGNADKIPSDLQAFNLFNDCITKILEERANLDLAEILRLQTALMTFALKCYPGRLDYVNYCLGMCASVLSATKSTELDENSIVEVEELLTIPLSSLALKVLDLKQYSELLCYLPYENRKQVRTGTIVDTIVFAFLSTHHTNTTHTSFSARRCSGRDHPRPIHSFRGRSS
jgi:vacuolar protein sorting-associated protein 35